MQKLCANITSRDTIQTVHCNPGMPVRYLTIRHDRETQLGICEVEVIGYQYQGMACFKSVRVICIQSFQFLVVYVS